MTGNGTGLTPYWTSGDGRAVLYCGDCREVLSQLSWLDVLITDPPYGVDLGTRGDVHKVRPRNLAKRPYTGYDDTPDNWRRVVVPAITQALTQTRRGLVFCVGTHVPVMPAYETLSGVFLPAGCGRTSWGFQTLAHFLLYGRCPTAGTHWQPIGFASTERAEASAHPCPKPLSWMVWCVKLASLPGETVIDPFCGTATTGVACLQTGRRFVGIEVDAGYCALAAERLEGELAQGQLFPTQGPVQLSLIEVDD